MDHDNIISLAAYREALHTGIPTREEYIGALYEWRQIARDLTPAELTMALRVVRVSVAVRVAR